MSRISRAADGNYQSQILKFTTRDSKDGEAVIISLSRHVHPVNAVPLFLPHIVGQDEQDWQDERRNDLHCNCQEKDANEWDALV